MESDSPIRRQMLQTAVAMVEAAGGLQVRLDEVSLEAVIKESGVSRSSAYREWPTREHFENDVLIEMARPKPMVASKRYLSTIASLQTWMTEQLAELSSPERRSELLREILRRFVPQHLAALGLSPEFRNQIAFSARISSSSEPQVVAQVTELLRAAEAERIQVAAEVYREMSILLGFRLREGIPSMEVAAETVAAIIEGVALRSLASPAIVEARADFEGAEWTAVSLACWGFLSSCFEIDPDYDPQQALVEYLKLMTATTPTHQMGG